jgi:hypothetical protein
MKFREQIEGLVQCKSDGICKRDNLVTVWLSKQIEGQDTDDKDFHALLLAKESDDNLLVKMLEKLNDE